MNPRHNLRASISLILLALLAIVIIVAVMLPREHVSDDTTNTQVVDVAFISSTPDLDSAPLDVKQTYAGAKSACTMIDKNLKLYTPSSTVVPETTTAVENPVKEPSKPPANDDLSKTAESDTVTTYSKLIQKAADEGAKLIICPDSSFAETIYNVQNNYTNTTFLLVNGIPHNSNSTDNTINYNVIPLTYDEAEAGFLAGYSLVYEGQKDLYFISSKDIESVHYAYGFIQGADYACNELSLSDVTVNYRKVMSAEEASATATKYYNEGAAVIACSGDAAIPSVKDIAVSRTKKMIVCGNAYSSLEENSPIVALAMMSITASIEDVITQFYAGPYTSGKIISYSAANNGVCYSFSSDYFTKFDNNIYTQIYHRLASDEIKIISDTTVSPDDLGLQSVTVNSFDSVKPEE